jgi:murein L,D-transpeptidase YcbB/YkuD
MGALNSAEGLAETEVSLTRGFLQFTSDLRWGRHNPGVYVTKSGNSSELLLNMATNSDGLEASLVKLDPPFDEFKRLLAALPQYRQSGTPEEVAKIELALERWRWLPREFRRGPILVNIPEFMVRVFDDKLQTVMTMRAIVGKPKTKTPILSGEVSHLIFGPYWNVPPSILHKEILPDIVKDRSYLTKNAYEVQTQQGEVVSTGEVTDEILAGLRSDRYKIRQVPGPKNALGRVKFMFPNNDHVYLHDTNSRNLFQKPVRALSHGCRRIEKPQELAEWALRNDPAWPKERILEALAQTHEQQVNLKQRIPVFIVYNTVTVNEAGEVTFLKDIYDADTNTGNAK